MLSLGRRYGERILITTGAGEEIWIEVKKRPDNREGAILAIDAPQSVRIAREEILKAKEEK